MSNAQSSAGSWYVDTASSAVIDSRTLYMVQFVWDSPTATTGDRVRITNTTGVQVWSNTALGPQWGAESPAFPQLVINGVDLRIPLQGFIVPQLDSGVLYFYFQPY